MKLVLLAFFCSISTLLTAQVDAYKTADKLFNDKQYQASIKLCTSELHLLNSKDTVFEKFLSLRANCYLEIHEYDQSINDYINLIKLYPKKTMYFTGLSYLFGEKKQYNKSIDILNKALNIDAKDIYVLNNLSYYSSQLNKFDDAIRYANDGLRHTGDPQWRGALLNNRGYGYIGLGKYSDALDDINESIKLNPDNSFAYCYRAIANIHLKKMETVCSDLKKAKDLGAIGLTKDLIAENCKN